MADPISKIVASRCEIVVMGISGAGKSSVGRALAARLGADFIDGDDLHAPASVAKMSRGEPLDDDDRWPWLDRVGATLRDGARHPAGAVVACSALKRIYRDRIRAAAPAVRFVFLEGDPALIVARQAARPGHFMPPSLMESQIRTLEPPVDEPGVFALDIRDDVDAIAARAARLIVA